MKKIVISSNTAWNIVNFRINMIIALQKCGYEIVVVSPYDKYVTELVKVGCSYIRVSIDRGGANPFMDALLLMKYIYIFHKERPDFYFGFTVKPNIYGSLAASFFGIRVINNISGLGSSFIKNNFLTNAVFFLYRLSLFRSSKVFFQNLQDLRLFVDLNIVKHSIATHIPGSGIDLDKFKLMPISAKANFSFLLVARLLWDKGIGEYVNASIILKKKYPDVQFYILGEFDEKNPSSISKDQFDQWSKEQNFIYLGSASDVRPYIENCDCVVLPSYREGASRALMEAAAMGRIIITSNVPGCQDIVDDDITGFICEVKSTADLVLKMEKAISLSLVERENMGLRARKKMELIFDEKIVIKNYIDSLTVI